MKTTKMTNKRFFKFSKRFIILIVVSQLLTTVYSQQFYPESSFLNIESQTDKNRLKDFLDAGYENVINTHNTNVNEIIRTAQKYLGVPHCMGGTTKKCMDCSGLLFTVFANYGIQLPHNAEEQARYGKIIAGMDDLMKGDLVFFIGTYKTNKFITHSGIYIGNHNFIHTSTSNGVTITSLNDPWWNEKFIFGTRVIN